ncbi:MAG: hypothetical protein ACR2P6_07695 [Gammaproteobacteria bacterium]
MSIPMYDASRRVEVAMAEYSSAELRNQLPALRLLTAGLGDNPVRDFVAERLVLATLDVDD